MDGQEALVPRTSGHSAVLPEGIVVEPSAILAAWLLISKSILLFKAFAIVD